DYAAGRYGAEARRLCGVLDRQLASHDFVAGDISIADFAIFPWAARYEWQGLDINDYENLVRWYKVMAARPGVQRGVKVPDPDYEIPMP
ncbi:MAG TPA: glutathione S-transferase, partial [Rhizobiales bacterium]|nr:glutathione S-transferase [Hyphomicrobiales bacterium]